MTEDGGSGGRRLFVAVPLPEAAARSVAALVEGVRSADGAAVGGPITRGVNDVRWVRLDALHVTLRFLGQTADERLPQLEEAVTGLSAANRPFDVRLAGGGAFPNPDRPRVLWIAVADGGDELALLARDLTTRLEAHGWPADERPFRPHLTLARSDGVRAGPRLAHRLMKAASDFSVTWQADRVVLFESQTGGGPARYVPIVQSMIGS